MLRARDLAPLRADTPQSRDYDFFLMYLCRLRNRTQVWARFTMGEQHDYYKERVRSDRLASLRSLCRQRFTFAQLRIPSFF